MKKLFSIIVAFLVITTLFITGCGNTSSGEKESLDQERQKFKIGISQYVEHPALDSAREGFIEGLKEAGFKEGENIEILLENAQADFPTTQTIANKFVSDKVDLILAIATPSAQSAANATKDIPIIITAVTDPVDAGLAESLESSGNNVTGTTDMNPIAEQLELIAEILPDAKNIGIIYNAGEPNSVVQVNMAKDISENLGFNIIEATISNSSEVTQATETLVSKVDAIYTPTDNDVVSAMGAVVKVANEAKIPIFGSERGQVDNGALTTLGIDYFLLGKQAGHIAAEVLKGEEPANLPIEDSKDFKLIINKKSADILDLNIPSHILSKADEIIE